MEGKESQREVADMRTAVKGMGSEVSGRGRGGEEGGGDNASSPLHEWVGCMSWGAAGTEHFVKSTFIRLPSTSRGLPSASCCGS